MKDKKRLIVSSITSKWHLYGLESYLVSSSLINEYDDLVVCIYFHRPSDSFRVKPEDFTFIKNGKVTIHFIKNYEEYKSIIYCKFKEYKHDELTIISVKNIELKTILVAKKGAYFRKINNVVLDEGIGTYSNKKLWDMSIKQEGGEIKNSILKYISDTVKKVIATNNILKKVGNLSIENRYLFRLKGGSLLVNDEIASAYKKYFNLIKDNVSVNYTTNNNYNILIISDILSTRCKDPNKEIHIYNMIVEQLKEIYPRCNIYIKPHPNEMKEIDKFSKVRNVNILTSNVSIEDYLNNNNIEVVFGFTSTALLTSAFIFGKKTVSLIRCVDPNLLSDFGNVSFKNFNNLLFHQAKLKILMFDEIKNHFHN